MHKQDGTERKAPRGWTATALCLALWAGAAWGQGMDPPGPGGGQTPPGQPTPPADPPAPPTPPTPPEPPTPPGPPDPGGDISIESTSFSDGETSRGEEHSKLLTAAQTIAPLGTSLFGESVNLFTGAVTFQATDVSIPSHAGPAVALSRRFVMETRNVYGSQYLFADWDLDLPYLSSVGPAGVDWRVEATDPTARCSAQAPPATFNGFDHSKFWQGYQLNNAAGGGELLAPAADPRRTPPATGGPYPWVTKGFWYFSCLPSLASGQAGEGFLGHAPDGTQVWFDWMSAERVGGISKPNIVPPGSTALERQEVRLYPTKIADRFGNWVAFDWVGEKLTAIRGKDGRQITLTYVQFDMGAAAGYDPGNRIAEVSDGLGTWRYEYDPAGRTLTRVIRPDGSTWQLDFSGPTGLKSASMQFDSTPDCTTLGCFYPSWDQTLFCSWMKKFAPTPAEQALTGILVHPSGAVGEFVFQPTRHARQQVPLNCTESGDGGGGLGDEPGEQNELPVFSDVWALVSKTVSGPGLATETWGFGYVSKAGSYDRTPPTGPTTRTVTVTNPDGSQTESTFGSGFGIDEGQTLQVRTLTAGGIELARTAMTYASNAQAAGAPLFPNQVGVSLQDRSDQFTAAALRPEIQRTTTQQGETFTWQVASVPGDFDAFANPTKVVRSSSLGFSRTETQSFHHNLSRWVLSQPETVCVVGVAFCASETVYDLGTALPIERRAFGERIETLSYFPDGSLASATDGNGHTTALGNWFRGVPQLITFADTRTRSAVADNWGRITATTDELLNTTNYSYDTMGRLTQIAYPGLAWTPTTFSFEPEPLVTEFGLPPGHWRHTQTTGAFKKTTYFDARLRPVLALEEDTTLPASKRYTTRAFDHEGRETFVSYPAASTPSFNGLTAGTATSFDALGRVTASTQTSELGSLTTSIAYLSGLQTQTTNPRGQATTVAFQAFDTPRIPVRRSRSLPPKA